MTVLSAFAEPPSSKVISNYYTKHKVFFKKLCTPGTEQKYYSLLRDYRGLGYYLPQVNEDMDIEAIRSNIIVMVEKKHWIESQIKILKAKKNWSTIKSVASKLIELKDELLSLKKDYYLAIKRNEKEKIRLKSQLKVAEIKREYLNFTSRISFLLNFNFPNDHLQNRREYDLLKDLTSVEDQRKANKLYMYRKIVEDGAMDKNNTSSDRYLRTTLDTLAIEIPKMDDFITEAVRYDLEWVIDKVDMELKRGRTRLVSRMDEWRERTIETIIFYRRLIQHEEAGSGAASENKKLIAHKIAANNKLKEFTNDKLAKTYEFWSKQPPIYRALFSIETILFNEVGRVDGPEAVERHDVARIVKNRTGDEFYRSLGDQEPIAQEIFKLVDTKTVKSMHWLNTLFKKGEFSFTYFYIGGVAKVFCPDMSRAGRNLRHENLKIAMDVLEEPKSSFDGLRYFSRASMVGRIDMSTVWEDYAEIAERPGVIVPNQNRLRAYFLADKYRYLYNFSSPEGKVYQVIEIDNENYAVTWENTKPKFFYHRNPHYFRYYKKSQN